MVGDIRRLSVAERHHIGRSLEVVVGRALAGQRLGNIYPCEQHRLDIESAEVLYHYSSATGEWWRNRRKNSRSVGTAMLICFCAVEGV